jgi:alpha-1,3-rhamnosyltransferase
MTALVSVLVPSYNYSKYVLDAIDSVLIQTLPDVELVIVDDGSSDDSVERIRQHLERLAAPGSVRFETQAHMGLCATVNTFVASTRSTYVAMLGADDLWEPMNLERQVQAFERAGRGYGASYADCWIIDANGTRTARWGEDGGYGEGDIYLDLVELRYFPPSTTSLFLRAAVERVGGWPQTRRIIEDQDLWLRIAKEYKVSYVDEPLGSHRVHGQNASIMRLDEFYADSLRTLEELLDRDADLRPRAQHLRARVEATHAGRLYGALRLRDARKAAARALQLNPTDRQAWAIAVRASLGRPLLKVIRSARGVAQAIAPARRGCRHRGGPKGTRPHLG